MVKSLMLNLILICLLRVIYSARTLTRYSLTELAIDLSNNNLSKIFNASLLSDYISKSNDLIELPIAAVSFASLSSIISLTFN